MTCRDGVVRLRKDALVRASVSYANTASSQLHGPVIAHVKHRRIDSVVDLSRDIDRIGIGIRIVCS